MSARIEYPNPDLIDVQNICAECRDVHALKVQFQLEVTQDYLTVIARGYKVGGTPDPVLHFQALSKKPLRQARDIAQQLFTTAFDIFCQADGGGATAAARGAPRGWNGRPAVARPRRKK